MYITIWVKEECPIQVYSDKDIDCKDKKQKINIKIGNQILSMSEMEANELHTVLGTKLMDMNVINKEQDNVVRDVKDMI